MLERAPLGVLPVGSAVEPEQLAREIEEVFVRRFRAVEGEQWNLRYLQRVGLRNFVKEVLAKGECKKVVQMPTGAGKSVLLSLLALAAVRLRERIREGGQRNVMLVFAPLNRIKFQLLKPLVIASGVCENFEHPPTFSVGCFMSEKYALLAIREKLFSENLVKKNSWVRPSRKAANSSAVLWVTPSNIAGANCVSEALQELQRYVRKSGTDHCYVAVLCPHILGKRKRAELCTPFNNTLLKYLNLPETEISLRPRHLADGYWFSDFLEERILALFVDEAHVMISGKLSRIVGNLAKRAPIVLGFTATPVVETFKTLIGGTCTNESSARAEPYSCDLFLYGKPIHSNDLILRRGEWIQNSDDQILVKRLVAYFYESRIRLKSWIRKENRDALWKNVCSSERAEEYANRVFEVLKKHLGSDADKAKILVLAPNTGEADLWYDVLSKRGVQNVFLAYSGMGSDALDEIDKFVNSDRGFLVAVDMVRLGFDDPNLDVLVIARPTRNMVAYVQMRGRVLRYPKSSERPKAKHGALILHLAADEVLEVDDSIRKVEAGMYSKREAESELSGFKGEVERVEMSVETVLKTRKIIGLESELDGELLKICMTGNVKRARELPDKGANVNARDELGRTPLHHAVSGDALDLVRLLISRGADVNARDAEGRTPLHYAAMRSSLKIVEFLLECKADPNAKDAEGRTPLHYAVERGARRIVKRLIDVHADVNARDKRGKTPLDIAQEKGHRRIAQLLARAALPQGSDKETGASREVREITIGPVVLKPDVWDKERNLPLLRVKVQSGKYSEDEICCIYLYPKGEKAHVSWRSGREVDCEVGEELERELSKHLGEYVRGVDAGEVVKQILEAVKR